MWKLIEPSGVAGNGLKRAPGSASGASTVLRNDVGAHARCHAAGGAIRRWVAGGAAAGGGFGGAGTPAGLLARSVA